MSAQQLERRDIRAELRYAQSGFRKSLEPSFRPGIDDAWVWKANQKSSPRDAFRADAVGE